MRRIQSEQQTGTFRWKNGSVHLVPLQRHVISPYMSHNQSQQALSHLVRNRAYIFILVRDALSHHLLDRLRRDRHAPDVTRAFAFHELSDREYRYLTPAIKHLPVMVEHITGEKDKEVPLTPEDWTYLERIFGPALVRGFKVFASYQQGQGQDDRSRRQASGQVVDTYWDAAHATCYAMIQFYDNVQGRTLCGQVETGQLDGASLQHVTDVFFENMCPLEVSICAEPRLPGTRLVGAIERRNPIAHENPPLFNECDFSHGVYIPPLQGKNSHSRSSSSSGNFLIEGKNSAQVESLVLRRAPESFYSSSLSCTKDLTSSFSCSHRVAMSAAVPPASSESVAQGSAAVAQSSSPQEQPASVASSSSSSSSGAAPPAPIPAAAASIPTPGNGVPPQASVPEAAAPSRKRKAEDDLSGSDKVDGVKSLPILIDALKAIGSSGITPNQQEHIKRAVMAVAALQPVATSSAQTQEENAKLTQRLREEEAEKKRHADDLAVYKKQWEEQAAKMKRQQEQQEKQLYDMIRSVSQAAKNAGHLPHPPVESFLDEFPKLTDQGEKAASLVRGVTPLIQVASSAYARNQPSSELKSLFDQLDSYSPSAAAQAQAPPPAPARAAVAPPPPMMMQPPSAAYASPKAEVPDWMATLDAISSKLPHGGEAQSMDQIEHNLRGRH